MPLSREASRRFLKDGYFAFPSLDVITFPWKDEPSGQKSFLFPHVVVTGSPPGVILQLYEARFDPWEDQPLWDVNTEPWKTWADC